MDRTLVPTLYAQRLTAYLAGGEIGPLLALFAEGALVERYVYGEPKRVYCGLEQIEESLLRLPPIGGSFHVTGIHLEKDAVHARFATQDFAYPMCGTYRFELDHNGLIQKLYVAARYAPDVDLGDEG
jgi:hypothetical protein